MLIIFGRINFQGGGGVISLCVLTGGIQYEGKNILK